MSEPKKFISLFSGCGGLDLGLMHAGFVPLASFELDKHARSTHQRMVKTLGHNNCLHFEDVYAVDTDELRKELDLQKGQLDLLCGGPPCQPFSLIGKRQSVLDHRGMLIYRMMEFVQTFMPKAVLIEQVKGILSSPGIDGVKGSILKDIQRLFVEMGYAFSKKVIRAADYGVPQLRDRLFMVAVRGNEEFIFPTQTNVSYKERILGCISDYKSYVTVKDALTGLGSPVAKGDPEIIPNHLDITPDGDRIRINGVPEGDYLARQLHLPKSQRKNLDPKKDTTKFRRLAWDQPSLTIRCGECFYHPSEDRYLTPRECLRLHSYPDSFVLEGPIRGRSGQVKDLDQHRQVANSVPPLLAEALGRQLVMFLDEHKNR